jgi:hypothetical protein
VGRKGKAGRAGRKTNPWVGIVYDSCPALVVIVAKGRGPFVRPQESPGPVVMLPSERPDQYQLWVCVCMGRHTLARPEHEMVTKDRSPSDSQDPGREERISCPWWRRLFGG